MASRKTKPVFLVQRDYDDLISGIDNHIMPGFSDSTYFIVPSISGTLDTFTEEVTFYTPDTRMNASGIVGAVTEDDRLLDSSGQVKIGDVKVTYPYSAVSGILGFAGVEQIVLLTTGVSGVYTISGRTIDVVGDQPIFVDYALAIDRNG